MFFPSEKKSLLTPSRALIPLLAVDGERRTGYVCLPLFFAADGGAGPLDGPAAAGNWRLLQAFLEVDPELAVTIRQAREGVGRSGGLDLGRLREKIRVLPGPGVAPELEEALLRTIVDRLSSPWDEGMGALLDHWQRFGHCDVPSDWAESRELADWVRRQRRDHAREVLDGERAARLEALGFVWDPEARAWEGLFRRLALFRQAHGHCKVPDDWQPDPELAVWVTEQRRLWQRDKLDGRRQRRLEEVGFVWDPEAAHWEALFAALERFKWLYGHARVADVLPEKPDLGEWAKAQRQAWEKGRIDPERQRRLDEVGFVWDLEAADWAVSFAALSRFHAGHGHCDPPASEPGPLRDWVGQQRRLHRTGRLAAERAERLDGLGFVWNPAEKHWNDMFDAMAAFIHREGHCHVPRSGVVPEGLSDWVRRVRRDHAGGRLSAERRERLAAIGFLWDESEAAWEEMFGRLKAFREARNHCIVPQKWEEDPKLARWVSAQRKGFRDQALSGERIARLDGLGFIWDAKAIYWEEMFAALAGYRDRYGNCLVPEGYSEHPDLAWWVAAQRKSYTTGQLTPERIERLTALDFFWDAQEAQWYEMYQSLIRYHQRHGNTLVPEGWADNPRLAVWVNTQRQARQHGHLGAVRVARLDELGFIWDPREVVVEEMLAELTRFARRFGHCNVPPQWPENSRLGLWMQFQRQAHKQGTLDPARAERLTVLGVDWAWDGSAE